MTNQCQHGQLARAREFHAAELADVTAERDQLRQYLDAAQRRGEELRAQVAALGVLLDDAIEEIEGWGEYAPVYFKQKHDLEGTLARFRAARKGRHDRL